MKEEYVEATKLRIQELKEVQVADVNNYKVIQEVQQKYEDTTKNSDRLQVEEDKIAKEGTQSVAVIFLEIVNGLHAITADTLRLVQ